MEYTPQQEEVIVQIARSYHNILDSILPPMADVGTPKSEISADLLVNFFIPNYLAFTTPAVRTELGLTEKDLKTLEERCKRLYPKKSNQHQLNLPEPKSLNIWNTDKNH